MTIQRSMVTCLAIVCLSVCVSFAFARGPNKQAGPQRGAGGPANGNPQMAAGAANGNAQQANGMGANMRGQQQNMPTIEQLAQALLTQFDADGSNALDQAELQAALAGLKQMMMQNQGAGGGQQQQMGPMMPQNQNAMPGGGRGPMGPGGGGRGGPGGQAGRGGR